MRETPGPAQAGTPTGDLRRLGLQSPTARGQDSSLAATSGLFLPICACEVTALTRKASNAAVSTSEAEWQVMVTSCSGPLFRMTSRSDWLWTATGPSTNDV